MIAAAVIVRDEQTNLLEWLAYHFTIGIRKFVIYDNESRDRTVDVVLGASRFYDIDLVAWPTFHGRTTQIFAYRDACFRLRTQADVEWCAFLDTDEYLLSTTGAQITSFTDRCVEADAICLNWAIFGSSGYRARPPGLMIEAFCHRAPLGSEVNNPVKTIVRPGAVMDCANPHFFIVRGQCVNGSNQRAIINERQDGTVGPIPDQEWRVNHYACKSRAQWQDRLLRGQCGRISVDEERWRVWDRNDEHDISAGHYYGAATRTELARIGHSLRNAQAA